MPRKKFKCPKCDRSFSMPGHLGRHMTATHGTKKRKKKRTAKKAKRTTKEPKKTRKTKKRSVRRKKKRAGRPKGVASRLGLGSMSLEELTQVIDVARAEARRKLVALEEAIG